MTDIALQAMRRLLFLPLLAGLVMPVQAEPVYLTCRGSSEKESGVWEVTVKPEAEKGIVSEITKNGSTWNTAKLPQFISNSSYTLQGIEVKSYATLNRTYKVDRTNGDYVYTFWMTNTGLAPRPPLVYRGKCDKRQPVKTMF